MLKTLGSIIMIMGGVIFVSFSFYDNYKKIVKIGTKKNNKADKYLKYKMLLDIIAGFCFIILGSVSIFNLYNGDLIWAFGYIILLLDSIIAMKINKKINTQSSYKM